MGSDIECFMCLIMNSQYMLKLIYDGQDSIEKHKDVIELFDWSKYKEAKDIIKLNNKHINNAVKEVLQNEKLVNELKENTNIDIEGIKKLLL